MQRNEYPMSGERVYLRLACPLPAASGERCGGRPLHRARLRRSVRRSRGPRGVHDPLMTPS
eukprot:4552614-Pyramimonas_sp.AAC.1